MYRLHPVRVTFLIPFIPFIPYPPPYVQTTLGACDFFDPIDPIDPIYPSACDFLIPLCTDYTPRACDFFLLVRGHDNTTAIQPQRHVFSRTVGTGLHADQCWVLGYAPVHIFVHVQIQVLQKRVHMECEFPVLELDIASKPINSDRFGTRLLYKQFP